MSYTQLSKVVSKTRKVHQCNACFGKIHIGEKLIRYNGVYEGDFCTFKMCEPCVSLAEDFPRQIYGGEMSLGEGDIYELMFYNNVKTHAELRIIFEQEKLVKQ